MLNACPNNYSYHFFASICRINNNNDNNNNDNNNFNDKNVQD